MMRALWFLAYAGCADPAPAEWSYVYASVLQPSCTTSACHSSLSTAGGVDLHDASAAYRALAGRDCDDTAAPITGYVDTNDPSASFLSVLLRREGPTGMPPNGRLSESEIDRIEAWMQAGALCE